MKESEYQKKLIRRIKTELPRCIVLKNDSRYLQGVPDLSVYNGSKYAMLEVKESANAAHQPNQDHYVKHVIDSGGFARFIYPENEEQVLEDMVEYLNK